VSATPSLREAALTYAARGLPVFPCRPDKKPFTSHGFKDASTSPAQIEAWWSKWPTALIGMPTGATTDLHVIDVDIHGHDGFATLKHLDLALEGLPRVVTPSGGNHLFHRLGGLSLRSTAGKLGPGIDTRGSGGYVILPPSRPDPARPAYEFINGVDLLAAPLIPKELVDLLRDRGRPTAKDELAAECARVATAPPGSRNDILNRAAFKLARLITLERLAEQAVRDALTKAALDNGLESVEIHRTLDSALGASKRDAGPSDRDAEARKQGRALSLPDPVPWDEPVNGAQLLQALVADLRAFVILSDEQAHAVALWALHAHTIDTATITPRLAITSPLPECGKTTLLDWCATIVPRPLEAANVTPSAMFRTIEAAHPTFLIDEADSFLRNNDELRGVLNSGHRRGGTVIRTVGDDHEPRMFNTWCACAIALIGKLPTTLHNRSIEIALRRRKPSEPVQSFRRDRGDDGFARRCRRWALDHKARLSESEPEMPDGLFNRRADNWRPLLAIADALSGPWPERAREAALALTGSSGNLSTLGLQLLDDIRTVFAMRQAEWLPSETLIADLTLNPEKPWLAYGKRCECITQRHLAALLRPFAIQSNDLRFKREDGSEVVRKGYELGQFKDAFDRYLPSVAAETEGEGP
jgi:Protein of unknown function (DUF3631)/Bifunctional DNA primase/polymerase, N-terminal